MRAELVFETRPFSNQQGHKRDLKRVDSHGDRNVGADGTEERTVRFLKQCHGRVARARHADLQCVSIEIRGRHLRVENERAAHNHEPQKCIRLRQPRGNAEKGAATDLMQLDILDVECENNAPSLIIEPLALRKDGSMPA